MTPDSHAAFREIMLHTAARENLFCPAYCLMPNHAHLMWMGIEQDSDQLNASTFLRNHLEPLLGRDCLWQHQPHDHVLRKDEREPNAFMAMCVYTLDNPVRAKLVADASDWPYLGAIVPGYPDLHPLNDGYWELFWKIYCKKTDPKM